VKPQTSAGPESSFTQDDIQRMMANQRRQQSQLSFLKIDSVCAAVCFSSCVQACFSCEDVLVSGEKREGAEEADGALGAAVAERAPQSESGPD